MSLCWKKKSSLVSKRQLENRLKWSLGWSRHCYAISPYMCNLNVKKNKCWYDACETCKCNISMLFKMVQIHHLFCLVSWILVIYSSSTPTFMILYSSTLFYSSIIYLADEDLTLKTHTWWAAQCIVKNVWLVTLSIHVLISMEINSWCH